MRRLRSSFPHLFRVLTHSYVPAADSFFDNVCELDLVFNFYKVRRCPGLSLLAVIHVCNVLT